MKRPRILVVKPVLPYPPEQGTRVVSFALIEALATEYDVTVLARILDREEEEHARALERWCTRVVAVLPPNRRALAARVAYRVAYSVRSFLTRRSLKSLYDCPGGFVRCARVLAKEAFDLVIIEYWQLYPLIDVFAAHRAVLLTHDIDQQVNNDRAALERSRWRRLRAARRAAVERREETLAYRRAQRVWALTPRDADAVRELSGGAPVDVLPFGVSREAFADPVRARVSREVLFMGAMGAAFNRDAIAYFARDIHPALADVPGIRFTVIGGVLPPEAASLGRQAGVSVVGHAPDPRVYLERAACLVVPLRYGGGLRIRIIEAMAAGLPVVCSPVAVAGMDLLAGREVLVARDPADYRRWIEQLFTDERFAAALAEAAQEAVRRRYGPEARQSGMLTLVARTIAAV